MAAPTYFSRFTKLNNADATTGWTVTKDAGGGGTPTANQDLDVFREGAAALSIALRNQTVSLRYALPATTDMANQHIGGWFFNIAGSFLETFALGGMRLYVYDGTNWSAWSVAGRDTYPGGWQFYIIDCNRTPDFDGGTPADINNITHIGYQGVHGTAKNGVQNFYIDAIFYGDPTLVTYEGESGNPATIQGLASASEAVNNAWGVLEETDTITLSKGAIIVGSGSNTTYFDDNGVTMVFQEAPVSGTLYQLVVEGNTTASFGEVVGEGSTAVSANPFVISTATGSLRAELIISGNIHSANLYGMRLTRMGNIYLGEDGAQLNVESSSFIDNVFADTLQVYKCFESTSFATELNNSVRFTETSALDSTNDGAFVLVDSESLDGTEWTIISTNGFQSTAPNIDATQSLTNHNFIGNYKYVHVDGNESWEVINPTWDVTTESIDTMEFQNDTDNSVYEYYSIDATTQTSAGTPITGSSVYIYTETTESFESASSTTGYSTNAQTGSNYAAALSIVTPAQWQTFKPDKTYRIGTSVGYFSRVSASVTGSMRARIYPVSGSPEGYPMSSSIFTNWPTFGNTPTVGKQYIAQSDWVSIDNLPIHDNDDENNFASLSFQYPEGEQQELSANTVYALSFEVFDEEVLDMSISKSDDIYRGVVVKQMSGSIQEDVFGQAGTFTIIAPDFWSADDIIYNQYIENYSVQDSIKNSEYTDENGQISANILKNIWTSGSKPGTIDQQEYSNFIYKTYKYGYTPFSAIQTVNSSISNITTLIPDSNLSAVDSASAISNGSGIQVSYSIHLPPTLLEFDGGVGTAPVSGTDIITIELDSTDERFGENGPLSPSGSFVEFASGDETSGKMFLRDRNAVSFDSGSILKNVDGTWGATASNAQTFTWDIDADSKSMQILYDYLAAKMSEFPIDSEFQNVINWGGSEQNQLLYIGGSGYYTNNNRNEGVYVANKGAGSVEFWTDDDGGTFVPPVTRTHTLTGLISGSEVTYMSASGNDTIEVYHLEDAPVTGISEYSYVYQEDVVVNIYINKPGYEWKGIFSVTLGNADASIPVEQEIDINET